MPTFSSYRRNVLHNGNTIGEQRAKEAQKIVDDTWNSDSSSVIGYLYSIEYDDEPTENRGLHPQNSKTKIPVNIKYIINSYQSLDKDNVDYRIQFRPDENLEELVPYYRKLFEDKAWAEFPIGLYIDIPDEKNVYCRWLIVANANRDNRDFPNYSILKCDFRFQWVYDGKLYEQWGVGRSQNSYNSGVWRDYVVETIENQRKFILPFNDDSVNIFYNQRFIISAPTPHPTAWRITKVESNNPMGIMKFTLAQDQFDEHTDFIEKDEHGRVVGMWADYYATKNAPVEDLKDTEILSIDNDGDYSEITYSGVDPYVKIKGLYKTLTIKYYNSNELLKNQTVGDWSFNIDGVDASELIDVKIDETKPNAIKIKFLGDEKYLNKILLVSNDRDSIHSELELKILAL